jgi:hypothetical protein
MSITIGIDTLALRSLDVKACPGECVGDGIHTLSMGLLCYYDGHFVIMNGARRADFPRLISGPPAAIDRDGDRLVRGRDVQVGG